jgi:hypothetical protein
MPTSCRQFWTRGSRYCSKDKCAKRRVLPARTCESPSRMAAGQQTIEGNDLLVATRRVANTQGIGLLLAVANGW